MNAIISKTAIAVVAALAIGASAASAVTVVNGSFEQDAGNAQGDGQPFTDLATGTGNWSWSVFDNLPGWVTTSGTGIEVQTTNTLDMIDPQDGQHYVELDGNNNSGIQQTINFANAGHYLLSFFYSPREGVAAGSNIIAYSLSDALTPFTSILSGSVTGPSALPPVSAVGLWTQITVQFVITQTGNYNLTFVAGGTDDSYGGLLDNVSISAAVVPVPAGGLLLLGALGAMAALRRRKTA